MYKPGLSETIELDNSVDKKKVLLGNLTTGAVSQKVDRENITRKNKQTNKQTEKASSILVRGELCGNDTPLIPAVEMQRQANI